MGMLLRRYYEVVAENVTTPDISKITEDKKIEAEEKSTLTRTIINRMSAVQLKEIAPKYGIEVTEETSGAFIKKAIIEKLGL